MGFWAQIRCLHTSHLQVFLGSDRGTTTGNQLSCFLVATAKTTAALWPPLNHCGESVPPYGRRCPRTRGLKIAENKEKQKNCFSDLLTCLLILGFQQWDGVNVLPWEIFGYFQLLQVNFLPGIFAGVTQGLSKGQFFRCSVKLKIFNFKRCSDQYGGF